MDDVLVVGKGHRLADLEHHAQRARHCPRRIVGMNELDHLAQGVTAHQGHGEEASPLRVQPQLVHTDDARVFQLTGHLGLLQEATGPGVAAAPLRPLPKSLAQHLHRDGAPDLAVPRPIDHPHAAAGDLALDLVATDAGRLGRLSVRLLGLFRVRHGRARNSRSGSIRYL